MNITFKTKSTTYFIGDIIEVFKKLGIKKVAKTQNSIS